VAGGQRNGQATIEDAQVREQSAIRKDLERSIRALLPDELMVRKSDANAKPTAAAAGLGGLFAGYVMGWRRGRKARKKPKK